MTTLPYGTSRFERGRGNFPSLPVVNMFAESVPTESQTTLQSRPGIEEAGIVMGSGPIQALYQIDGVLNNELFGVSDGELFSSGNLIGSIDGTGHVTMAGYEDYLFVNAGSRIWGFDGTTLAEVAFPDSAPVTSICVGASRLIGIRKDTGKFYWSEVLHTTIDGLSFATAENSPDKLKACLFIGDTLILFGSETVEFWPATSDADAPYAPLVGRVFQVGIRGTESATMFNSTFAWVTNRNQVCVSSPDNVISMPGLDAKIGESDTARLWTFRLEGVEFLGLTLDNETWVFNPRASSWSTFESDGYDNWIVRAGVGDYLGSAIDGRLFRWSDDHTDLGGTLERRFRAGQAINSSILKLDNIAIRTNTGQTPYLTGDYTDPTIELRTSKDGGHTWSSWRQNNLGAQGAYRTRVQWISLGSFSFPGVLVEFRVTDPVPFRVSDVVINEPYGGV